MDIIKELNLNKTPNTIKSGSLVGAKNIIIDDTSSYITREDGFKIEVKLDHVNEHIVGCIPCNEELVIFTYDGYTSRIYRKKDNGIFGEIPTKWQWSGGIIVGDYTYNYKNQLVICVGEYGVDNLRIPLKSWILPEIGDTEDTYIDYNICPDIPIYNCQYEINKNDGNLICGRYVYFIRFKIYDDTYTNWFQITDDIFIINHTNKERPVLHYATSGTSGQNYKIHDAGITDSGTVLYPDVVINDPNNLSSKSIKLHFNFKDSKYDAYQLGYIFKRESETIGRILGDYKITDVDITFSDNNYVEEESIDKFLRQPQQFYNVQNVRVYNDRVYIANFEEDEILDLGEINGTAGYKLVNSNDIYDNTITDDESESEPEPEPDPSPEPEPEPEPTPSDNTCNVKFVVRYYNTSGVAHYISNTDCENISYYEEDGNKYINNPMDFLKRYLVSQLKIRNNIDNSIQYADNTYFAKLEGVTYTFHFSVRIGNYTNSQCIEIFNNFPNSTISPYIIKINDDNTLSIIRSSDNFTINLGSSTRAGLSLIAIYQRDDVLDTTYYYVGHPNSNGEILVTRDGTTEIPDQVVTNADIIASASNILSTASIDNIATYDTGLNSTNNYYNRTLLPYQIYNFFVHFIRKNGSITMGYRLNITNIEEGYNSFNTIRDNNNNLIGYIVDNLVSQVDKLIIPHFHISKPNDDYIGYFISYEALENKISSAYKLPVTNHFGGAVGSDTSDKYINKRWNSSAYLYGIDSIRGNTAVCIFDNTQFDLQKIEHINNSEIEKHFQITPNNNAYVEKPFIFYNSNRNIYKKDIKTLYRLTENIYFGYNEDYTDTLYLPGFYAKEIIPYFSTEVIGSITSDKFISPSEGGSFGNEDNKVQRYPQFYISCINTYNYTFYPYFALSIKQDYKEAVVNFTDPYNTSNPNKGLYYNSSFMPVDVKDFLELQQCYIDVPLISYTNYRNNYVDKFPKTIYRSDVYSDENANNSFKEYQPENYKNIFENKGNITNIIPIGLILLIHTEYSLFAFDRSPKLSLELKSEIPDTFDINYQEIITKSFGGLKDKRHSIICKFGYIWFDEINKLIFRYDDTKFTTLSLAINNFIKKLDIYDIRFAMQSKSNRLLICIYTKTYSTITISYNFNTETFISVHDYSFTDCYKTSNEDYIFDDNKSINKLYIFDSNEIDYKELYLSDDVIFDFYKDKRYIDLIINDDYNTPKIIESISYVLNNIVSDFDLISIKNVVEENLNRRYSGDQLYIYTDETATGELDINVDNKKLNTLNDYKYPYWSKGKWNLNYFRNTVATDTIPTKSDNQSVIYGKYFVIRFIFNSDRKFKFESIDINLNVY